MKKQIILFIMMLLPMVAGAEAVEIDGIYYELVTKAKQAIVNRKPSGSYNGDVVIPASVTYEGSEYSVTRIGDNAFFNSSGLTSITIPNSVTSIGERAFYNCSGLTSVTIPGSLTSIGMEAFYYCRGLTSVTIPGSVKGIGESAFSNCSRLTSVHISDIAAWCKIMFSNSSSNPLYYARHLYLGDEEIIDLVIPNSVTSIGNSAFSACSYLTSVTIPNSVTSIGSAAFYYCSGLTSITIPNSVTSIGSSAFWGCSGLTSVTIGSSVTSIGDYAFRACSDLASITIPNSVTSMGKDVFLGTAITSPVYNSTLFAFLPKSYSGSYIIPHGIKEICVEALSDCRNLTSVTIPNSLTSIGNSAFANCSGLASVTIPDSVTSIGNSAFANCTGLKTIAIGRGVKIINSYAFVRCPELIDVYCFADDVPSTDSPFNGSYIEYANLYVPKASVEKYKKVSPWKDFKSIVGLEMQVMPKCATPIITINDGELTFSCETEGVEYVSEVTSNEVKKYYDDKLKIGGIYTISVYATKAGYENSDVATLEFTLGAGDEICDVNRDGAVDVADISTIINKMAGK